jgi:nucleoside-diphosphate-sugar epimerase
MVHIHGVVNVLVTGAAGFIGSHLAVALRRRGFRVRGFILPTDDETLLAEENVEVFKGDVTRGEDCSKAVGGMDVVFHLAAIVNDWCPRKPIIRVNAGGTESLLRAASLRGVRRFVLLSSLAVHDFHPYRSGDENAPRDAHLTAYAESKILAEDLARRYHAGGLIETVIVRPGLFPLGPRDRTSFLKLVRGLRKRIYAHINRGRSVFCTAYVENLVEGIVLAGVKRRAAGETFVIADPPPVRWKNLIDAFCKHLGIERIRRSLPGWLTGSPRSWNSAIKSIWPRGSRRLRAIGSKCPPRISISRARRPERFWDIVRRWTSPKPSNGRSNGIKAR